MFKRYLLKLYHKYMAWVYDCKAAEADFYQDHADAVRYWIKSEYHKFKGEDL